MKKHYTFKSLAFISSILLLLSLFNTGSMRAQCTTPTNQALSSSPASLPCNGNITVTLATSQAGVSYYLRNDANNNVISGPFIGSGGATNLIAGNISSNTTFNVYAVGPTRSMFFDGFDDQAVIANAMSTTGDFTWEAWFKTTSTGGTIMSIAPASGNYNIGAKSLFIRYSRLSFDCYGIGYMEMSNYISAVNNNQWHHVAITNKADYSGSLDKTSMYLDGQLVSVRSDWDITSSQGTGMVNKIGYTNPDFPTFPAFSGQMDDVKFWSTVRTNNEVIADMTSCPAGSTTGLEAFYKFEDGTSTTLTDNGAGTHPGVLTNMGTPNTLSDGRDACSTCTLQMTTKPSVTIGTITAQSVSVGTPSFCTSGSTSVTTGASEANVNYYMTNSTNTTVSGPVAGTGSGLNFSTGTLNSTTTYTITGKRTSGALQFDGLDDIISCTETPALAQFSTTPMTMEAWVYPTNISTIRSVIRKEGSYNLYLNNGRIYFEMYRNLGGGTNYTITLGQTILPVNQWSHIAASWQGGIYADIFLNGNQEVIGGGSSTNNNVAPLSIGRTSTSNQPFAGKLDDIRIWNTARTAAQIKANMRACLTGAEAGLLLNYKFDDSGTNIIDAAGGDNNGTLLNADISSIYTSGVDNCGCAAPMASAPTVTIFATPAISTTNSLICSGNSAVITPTGAGTGATYSVTGGTFTVSPTTQTSYSVTGTSSAGCVASNTAVSTVSVNTTPTVSATSGSICSGQSFNIVPSGATFYNISGGTFNVSPSVTTSYSVTGSTGGCTSNTFVSTVTVSASPTLAINSATICSGNSAVLTPSGANNYTITGGSYTVSPGSTTSYSLTGSSNAGCAATNTAVATVSINAAPVVSVNSATICSGNSVALVPSGAASYTITGGNYTVSPGTTTSYSVTGATAFGCPSSNTAVATVSVNATPTLNVNNATICSGNSVAIVPTGAGTYTITGGSFTVSPTTTTSYTVTGTAASGCPASNTVVSTISVNITPTLTVNNPTICPGATAVISPTGGVTYTITGGSFNVSPGTTTSYSVTGTAANGCSAANPAVSTVSLKTPATLNVNNATICTGNSVAIVPTGGATYTITGGNFTVSPNATTSYSVTGTGTNGCAASNTAVSTISVNTTPTLTVNNGTICSGNSIAIVPGGANTYTITGGSFNVSPSSTTAYSVTGTAANGCVASNTAVSTISVNTTPTLAVNSATICSGSSATIIPSGANTYTITGGSYNVSPNTTTDYSVTGTAANGCVASNTAISTISVNTTPTLTVNNATICSGNSAAINPSGANTYTITGGSFNVSPNTTTSYSVTGTAANGCVASNTAVSTVSVNATPTLAINSGAICPGNSYVLIPSGAGTYTITGGTFTVTPGSTTSYTLTGTGANGCVAANAPAATVSVVNTLTVSVSGATNVCSSRTVVLTASGASTYTWSTGVTTNTIALSPSANTTYTVYGASGTCSNNAVVSLSVLTTPTVTVNSATICSGNSVAIVPSGATSFTITGNNYTVSPNTTTSYSVTGTATNGCISNAAVSTISVNTTPTLTVNNPTICSGNSVAIAPTGAGVYTITGNNFTVTPALTTTYAVTGTGTNGCAASNTAIATVSVKASPTITVNSPTICSGSSVALVASGANTYTITGNSFTVSPATSTSYSVTGTGTNGCVSSNTAAANVTVYALPTITVNSGVICPGNSFTLVPAGAATYTYSNGSNVIVNPVATNNYSVTGTSVQGCHATNTAVATVSVVNTLTITVAGPAAICTGQTATLTAGGATTYTWDTGVTTDSITLNPTATTSYTVSGASGTCSNTAVVTLSVNALPAVAVNSGQVCAGNSFVVMPTGADTYSINGNTFTVTPTATTDYTVSGTDANGCVSAEVVSSVTVNALPAVTAVSDNTLTCIEATTTLTASGADTYSWSTMQTDAVIAVSPTQTTVYTVTGFDANGCSASAAVTQSVTECTGIKSAKASTAIISLYPNPNTGSFVIDLITDAKVIVYNNIGQEIINETRTAGQQAFTLLNKANGIYFVKVVVNGKQETIKIIKE